METKEKSIKMISGIIAKRHIFSIAAVDTKEPYAAITIDIGYDVSNLDAILKLLEEEKLNISFFITGLCIKKNPDKIEELKRRGHEICNHSYSHPNFDKLSKNEIERELQETEVEIERHMPSTRLFRFPYGKTNRNITEYVYSLGYIPIRWNVDSLDWDENNTLDRLLDNTLPGVKRGSIFLFHSQGKLTIEAIRLLNEEFKRKGIANRKVSELIHPMEKSVIYADGIQRLRDED